MLSVHRPIVNRRHETCFVNSPGESIPSGIACPKTFSSPSFNYGIGRGQGAIMQRASYQTMHTNSTLADLPAVAWVVDAATTADLVKGEFDRQPNLPGVIVRVEGKLLGIIARDTFFRRLSGPYCRELFLRKPIRDFLAAWPIDVLELPSGCSIHTAAELALARPNGYSYEPILVDYGKGEYRLLDTHALLVAQSQLLALSKVIAESATRPKRRIAQRANFWRTSRTSFVRRYTES